MSFEPRQLKSKDVCNIEWQQREGILRKASKQGGGGESRTCFLFKRIALRWVKLIPKATNGQAYIELSLWPGQDCWLHPLCVPLVLPWAAGTTQPAPHNFPAPPVFAKDSWWLWCEASGVFAAPLLARGAAKGPAMAVPGVPLSGTIVLLLLFYYYIWDFFSPVCVLHTVRCANAGQKTALVRGWNLT